jgi:hypothetical protein
LLDLLLHFSWLALLFLFDLLLLFSYSTWFAPLTRPITPLLLFDLFYSCSTCFVPLVWSLCSSTSLWGSWFCYSIFLTWPFCSSIFLLR